MTNGCSRSSRSEHEKISAPWRFLPGTPTCYFLRRIKATTRYFFRHPPLASQDKQHTAPTSCAAAASHSEMQGQQPTDPRKDKPSDESTAAASSANAETPRSTASTTASAAIEVPCEAGSLNTLLFLRVDLERAREVWRRLG